MAKTKKVKKDDLFVKTKEVRCVRAEKLQADKTVQELLDHWNSKGIAKYRPTNKRASNAIGKSIKDYKVEEIKDAIDRYATVFYDDEYSFFTYAWTLNSFLSKPNAMPDFMEDGQKWINYCRFKEQQQKKKEQPAKKPVSIFTDGDIYRQYLNYMQSLPYDEYLLTEHWQHFRVEALKSAQYKCAVCGATGMELNVHHNNYFNRGRETFNDVVVLCKICHIRFHAPDEIGAPINHAKIT